MTPSKGVNGRKKARIRLRTLLLERKRRMAEERETNN